MTDFPQISVFNATIIIVDKISKLLGLVSCMMGEIQLTVPKVTKLFFKNCVQFFRLPKYVVHDKNIHLTPVFWKEP